MIARNLVIATGAATVAGLLSASLAFASGGSVTMSGNAGGQAYSASVDTNSGTAEVSYGDHSMSVPLDLPNQDSIQAAIDWATGQVPSASNLPDPEKAFNDGVEDVQKGVNDGGNFLEKGVNDGVSDAETAINDGVNSAEQNANQLQGAAEGAVNTSISAGEKEFNSVNVTAPTVQANPTMKAGSDGVAASPGVTVSGGSVSFGNPLP